MKDMIAMQTIKQNPEIKEAAEFLKEKWKWINEVRSLCTIS